MLTQWIQFLLLFGAVVTFLLRNEHRLSCLERDLKAEQKVSNMLDRRIVTLERKHS